MAEDKRKLVWQFRIIYYTMLAVLVAGVLTPILYKVPDYPFLWDNILFILLFGIFFHWIFFLRLAWFGTNKWVKLVLMFLVIPIIILLMDRYTDFQAYLDDYGIQHFLGSLSFKEGQRLGGFIRTEMLFFGVASILSAILVGFRMIISIWRYKNRGIV